MATTTPTPSPILISTTDELKDFLSTISTSNTLYLDLEGQSLSRNGTICIISILVYPSKTLYLIDITTLASLAFTTAAATGQTLTAILANPTIQKCFWDVRNDADALHALYNVPLAAVTDIQLLENASRTRDKTYLCGLAKAIEYDLHLPAAEKESLLSTKKAITTLMATDIFAARPMDAQTIAYCANDIRYLPALREVYEARLTGKWAAKVREATALRLLEARGAGYLPRSGDKKFGPWGGGAAVGK